MDVNLLNCPLCCNESFDSPVDLKLHILDVLNRLNCPTCDEHFSAFDNFILHIKECEIEGNSEGSEIIETDIDINSEGENVEDNNGLEEDYLIPEETLEENEYYCEICDVRFTDMKKHLMEKHMGQQVVVDSQDFDEILEETQAMEQDEMETETMTNNTETEHIFLEQELLDEEGKFLTKTTTKINIVPEIERSEPIVENMYFGETSTELDDEKSLQVHRCEGCNIRFLDLRSYNKHDCKSIKGEICSICSIIFTTKSGLYHHRRKHHSDSCLMFKCDHCSIEFETEKSMILHRKIHAPIINQRTVDSPVTYNLNGNLISEDTVEMFTCEICGKEYNKKYEEVHIKSHSEEYMNCSICNRKFLDKDDLSLHLQAHGNDVETKISCRFCKKNFTQTESLEDHIRNQCEGRKFACTFCGRKFMKPHEKVKHERIHTGHKPHICEICGKGFRVSYCLTLHLRTHSGIRPYQCQVCSKRFKSHGAYKHHIRIHSDVRPYQCTFCPKAFKTSVQLAGHKNTHTKPFSCNICNRPFSSLYAVRLHTKSHEKKNDLKHQCHICGAEYVRLTALRDHMDTHSECSEMDSDKLPKKTAKKSADQVTEDHT